MSNKKRWVSDLPALYHPDNRIIDNPDECSLVELLAAIIGGKESAKVADRLFCQFTSLHELAMASIADLCDVPGVSLKTAKRLKAVIAFGRKLLEPVRLGSPIREPKDAAEQLLPILSHRDHERFIVMMLDTNKNVKRIKVLNEGSVNASVIRTAEVFKEPIGINAASIILAHNHPSGTLRPSENDMNMTKDLINAGRLLNIDIDDHIIIGHADWISMKVHSGYLWI